MAQLNTFEIQLYGFYLAKTIESQRQPGTRSGVRFKFYILISFCHLYIYHSRVESFFRELV